MRGAPGGAGGVLSLSALRLGAVRVSLPVLDERRRGTRFLEQSARSVINPPESTGMEFWSVNPYVGCEFGCTYCYARFAHRYVAERARDAGHVDGAEFADLRGPHGWEAFERRIFVKRREDVLAALERDLPRVRRRAERERQSIAIGTATDPYQPAERRFRITRAVLERFRREWGFGVGIISKSPLVRRDTALLAELSRQHDLKVYVSLITVDEEIIRAFEPRSPMPHARLRPLRHLVDAGINAGLIVAPVLPGITDTADRIRALLVRARDAGARFAVPVPLRLYPAVREPFLPALERYAPGLVSRYLAAYRDAADAPEEYAAALRDRFERIAHEVGIPTSAESSGNARKPVEQMELWGDGARARADRAARRRPAPSSTADTTGRRARRRRSRSPRR